MSSLFDTAEPYPLTLADPDNKPVAGEVRTVNGIECAWHERDPGDPFDESSWVPIEAAPLVNPAHKPAPSTDEVYQKIKKSKATFRALVDKHYAAQGYFGCQVERHQSTWSPGGFVHTTSDLWGIFDALYFSHGEVVAVQFTSKANLGTHLTKMCSHLPVGKKDKTHRSTYLRRWLEHGFSVHLIGFYKDGARWAHELRVITLEVMDRHEPGRRFRK